MRKRNIDDVISALEDALEIAEEVSDDETPSGARAAVVDAITAIRQGRYDDAVTTLEREFLPKWKDTADCLADYNRAVKLAPIFSQLEE